MAKAKEIKIKKKEEKPESIISIRDITKQYGDSGSPALHSVSFDIAEGEFVSLVGQSGAGKSTLVRLIIAEERPDEGSIKVKDWDVDSIRRRYIPKLRRNVGVVFQDYKLLEKKTAYENIAFAMEVVGSTDEEIEDRVPKMLELVDLREQANHFPSQLSGGEKQRVAIARAMIHEPDILIADEPTGNLDSLNAWEVIQLIMKINELGTTTMMVTHNKDIINAIKKRVVTLEKGRLVKDQKRGKYVL